MATGLFGGSTTRQQNDPFGGASGGPGGQIPLGFSRVNTGSGLQGGPTSRLVQDVDPNLTARLQSQERIAAGRNRGGQGVGGARFTPTASGLFANAADPFGGQNIQNRLQGRQNLLGATGRGRGGPTASGVPGSQTLSPNPFVPR